MEYTFEAEDPRGYRVICTEETWKWHIVQRHPEFDGEEDQVKQTIEHPWLGIYQDTKREDRHIYYRRSARNRWLIKVVVQFDEELIGQVITAIPAQTAKAGEKLIWLGK